MRGLAKATLVAIAIVAGAITSAPAQQTVLNGRVPPVVTHNVTPLGWYVIGSIGCAAVSPMIATAILGRELFGLHVGPSGLAFDGRDVSACRDSHEYPAADTAPQAKKEEYRARTQFRYSALGRSAFC